MGRDRIIEEALQEYGGAKVKKVGDAVFAGAAGALKLALNAPLDCWKQMQEASVAEPAVRKAA